MDLVKEDRIIQERIRSTVDFNLSSERFDGPLI